MIDPARKKVYKYFLEEDKKATSDYYCSGLQNYNPFLIDSEIWKFQKTLRKCEFLYSTKDKSPLFLIKKLWYAYRFKKLSIRLGFTIPTFVFGPGLRIAHRGTIVVHSKCRIGSNCTLNAGINIGTKAGFVEKVPIIGNNVYIGPGAKIYGEITIADGCAIGANAVVNKSFLEPGSIIAGIPAKVIGRVDRNLQV